MNNLSEATDAATAARSELGVSSVDNLDGVEEPGQSVERSYSGLVFALFAAYLLFATALYYFRGFRFINPDRWAPFLFLAALALGRGRSFIRDWAPFVLLLFGYEYMRGIADSGEDIEQYTAASHGRIHLDWLLDAELWFFRGEIPAIWLQERLYVPGDPRWYDMLAGFVYLLHFVFPLVFAFILWMKHRDHYWQFTIALVTMSYIGFVFFLLMPSAPPWLANDWGVIQGLERPTGQAFRAVTPNRVDNFNTFQIWTNASPNPVAAFPSLHAAFPWLVLLFGVRFLGRGAWVFLVYNAAVWFSIIYLGLHWAIDIFAGIALATAVFFGINWIWPRVVALPGLALPAGISKPAARATGLVAERWAAAWLRARERSWMRELGGIAAVTVVAVWVFAVMLDQGTMIGIDSATQFYPVYGLLGELLRAGEIPLWNRHIFAGSPLLADPQSGWMYFPVMALFTIFPLAAAVKLFVAVHLLMMTLGTYLLARVLGLSIVASCVAAAAYQLSTHAVQRSSCCPVETEVLAWFPFALAGVALAVRLADRWLRAAAWGLAGLSLAQILVAWTGQGAYYATLAVGGFIAYLTLFDPTAAYRSWRERLREMVIHGISIGALATGLAAAALLPRLEFRDVSNLADGYPWDGVRGGWPTLESVIERLIGLSSYTTGATLLALALIGVVTGRRRYAAPYFGLLAVLSAALAWRVQTPIHDLLDAALPGFESMRQNRPERGLIVFFVPVAILAGIAIDQLPPLLARSRRSFMALVPAGLMTLLVIWLAPRSDLVGRQAVLAMLVVDVILAAAVLLPLPPLRRATPWLLTSVLLLELFVAATTAVHRDQSTGLVGSVDLNTYYDPAPAAEFLASLPDDQLFRFAGYDTDQANRRDDMLYRRVFLSESTSRIAVNNRAALIGLEDVQGGSLPMHIMLYDDLISGANGTRQDYHDANLFAAGTSSPILDLLNVRYLIVPANVGPGRPDLLHLNQRMPTVYLDGEVRILENTDALPRAWIVHNTQDVGIGEAIPLLASGAIDPRQVALFEGEAPALPPANGSADVATVIQSGSSGMSIKTQTRVDSLLMLSEIAYPAWHAYVDGEQVPLLTADHALRAIPIPAGEHIVELRYESTSLRVGIAITTISYAALVAILVCALVLVRRRPRSPQFAHHRLRRLRI